MNQYQYRDAVELVENHREKMARATTEFAKATEECLFSDRVWRWAEQEKLEIVGIWQDLAEINSRAAEEEEHGPDCGEAEMHAEQRKW